MLRHRRLLALLALASAVLPAASARAADMRTGYLTMPDGVQLRYEVLLPPAGGRAPVMLSYDGHYAGTAIQDDGNAQDFLGEGYAVVGVSARGTGCSGGQFKAFDPVLGEDGARVVQWAASQDFSNGNVGMFGFSFGGILQEMTAAERPPALRAISPGSVISDVYRDVAHVGGLTNTGFTTFFDALIREEGAGTDASHEAQCDTDALQHDDPSGSTVLTGFTEQHPDRDGSWAARSPDTLASQIDVPALVYRSWQDPTVGSRDGELLQTLDPARTWTVETNGTHGLPNGTKRFGVTMDDFFARFVKGDQTAWINAPHAEVWHETGADGMPRWITSSPGAVTPTPARLYLRAGGAMSLEKPLVEVPDVFQPGAGSPSVNGSDDNWASSTPVSGAALSYTTPPLSADLTQYGSASLDLWVASSQPDADLQATITEVRPDGQEEYVQRGWLRLSRRKLDDAASTELRPLATDTASDVQTLVPGVPVLARLEILPFGQTFRRNSSIRVWLDAPTGSTGVWRFPDSTDGDPLTVLHDAAHPSALVLGDTGETGPLPLPGCGAVLLEPCRANPTPVPAGTLAVPRVTASSSTTMPSPSSTTCTTKRSVKLKLSHPAVSVQVRQGRRVLRTRRGRRLTSVRVSTTAHRVVLTLRVRDTHGALKTSRRTLEALSSAC